MDTLKPGTWFTWEAGQWEAQAWCSPRPPPFKSTEEFLLLTPEFTTMHTLHHGDQSPNLFAPQAPSPEFNWRTLAVKPTLRRHGKVGSL
jgi:hypothetical protein